MSAPRVVVTGLGVVSAYGTGRDAFWSGLAAGQGCARMLDFPGIENLPVRFAAPVPLRDEELAERLPNAKSAKTMSRAATFAMLAAVEAMQQSGLDGAGVDRGRVGTTLGMGGLGLFDREYVERTFDVFARAYDAARGAVDRSTVWRLTLDGINPLTPLKALPNIATAHVAIQLDARGPSNTYTTACTSGAQAIGEAYRMIQRGECDAVIAGGADSMVNPNGMVAFTALGVLSQNNDEYQAAARPFDKRRDGFMLGEGAAVMILESWESCRARGAEPIAEVMGYAATSDAYRLTDEPPDARGTIAAMQLALRDARIPADAVDYVNVHGTGTAMNDRTETHAIRRVFGHHADRMPVSSTKSMIGHLVAAAGAAELAACVLAIAHSTIPPTINYQVADPECDLDCVPNHARAARLRIVASNSFGFGGQNACLVVGAV